MSLNDHIFPEDEVNTETLANFVQGTGRTVLSVETDHLWVVGNDHTNIQIGHVQNKKAICMFAGRPLPDQLSDAECALLANRLNAECDVIRFYFRFVETAKRNVLFIDHYVFYNDVLVKSHFLMSLQFVEFFALEFSIL